MDDTPVHSSFVVGTRRVFIAHARGYRHRVEVGREINCIINLTLLIGPRLARARIRRSALRHP